MHITPLLWYGDRLQARLFNYRIRRVVTAENYRWARVVLDEDYRETRFIDLTDEFYIRVYQQRP